MTDSDSDVTASVLYEEPAPGIARIVLNRPEAANAQDKDLLYKLNDARSIGRRTTPKCA